MFRDLNKAYPLFLWVTVIIASIVFFWGLGSIELMSLNEGRRALAIKEMVSSGDWLLPHLNGELYLTKPPLLYWISSAFALVLGGVSEWTLRLPSAFAAVTVLTMAYRYTLKQSGQWAALFSVQLLVANLGFAMLGRRAEIEMLLTALCVGSLLSALKYIQDASDQLPANKNWIYLSYFLLALALMTKGPLVLLFVTLPLIIAAIYSKNPHVKAVLLSWQGWLIFFVVGLAWYASVTWKLGFDIWGEVIRRDMLEKMQGGESSAKPLLSYLGWIAVDSMLLIGLFFVRFKDFYRNQIKQPHQLVLLLSIILPLLVFSLFSNKHAKYLLPIYPLIAILLAMKLASIFDGAKQNVRKIMIVLGVLLPIGIAVFYVFLEPKIFAYRVAAFPGFAAWASEHQQKNLYAYKEIDSRLVYYANRQIQVLDEKTFNQTKESSASFLLLVNSDDLNGLQAKAGCKIKEFRPYLKKHKSLLVFGFGQACQNS